MFLLLVIISTFAIIFVRCTMAAHGHMGDFVCIVKVYMIAHPQKACTVNVKPACPHLPDGGYKHCTDRGGKVQSTLINIAINPVNKEGRENV